MQAWLCETLEGIGAMRFQTLPTPEPQAGEVRIAIGAASLNFPDLLIVEGVLSIKSGAEINAREIQYRHLNIESGAIVKAQMQHLDFPAAAPALYTVGEQP